MSLKHFVYSLCRSSVLDEIFEMEGLSCSSRLLFKQDLLECQISLLFHKYISSINIKSFPQKEYHYISHMVFKSEFEFVNPCLSRLDLVSGF